MEKREPYPLIEITAETPFERGVQYGRQAVDRIGICIEYYKESFKKQGFTWDEAKAYAMGYVPVIEESMPEILEEAKGLASGSGRELAEIMAVNCRYEISKISKPEECTTAAVLPEASRGGKTYAVKNWDFLSGRFPTSYCCASAQRSILPSAGPRRGRCPGRGSIPSESPL